MTSIMKVQIQDIKNKLNNDNNDEINAINIKLDEIQIEDFGDNDTVSISSDNSDIIEITDKFQKKRLLPNDIIECSNCKRHIRRDGYSKHLLSNICLIDDISFKRSLILEDVLRDKFKKYTELFLIYRVEYNVKNKKTLFIKLKKIYDFLFYKIFNSIKLTEENKEILVNELFVIDFKICTEHIEFCKNNK
jgi:hypothetical protein